MMKQTQWLIAIAIGAFLFCIAWSSAQVVAQSPSPSPSGTVGVPVESLPVDPSLPNPRPPIPSPSPSPTASPTAGKSPVPVPSVPGAPPIQVAPGLSTPLPAAPTAEPLPLGGEYKDPAGRFKVGILKDAKVTPLAGSVLMESADGNLAYTVLSQPQTQLGIAGNIIPNDALIQIAQNAFKQGEGFQTGEARSITNGVQLDWTGNLTIAGKTQPVGGVILARQTRDGVLLLLIAATNDGGDRVLSAATALNDGLQSLQ